MSDKVKPKPSKGGTPKGAKRGPYKTSEVELDPLAEPKEKVITIPDLFEPTPSKLKGHAPKKKPAMPVVGGVDRMAHDINLLKVEWAIKYPLMAVKTWLTVIKGYSREQSEKIMALAGGESEWQAERGRIMDKLTESVVKRHLDQLAEVQETHIKASKIGLAKCIEYLSKLTVEPVRGEDGKMLTVKRGGKDSPVWKGFRSIDMLNIMNAIKTAQEIYRRAMGLPNDEGGLAQLLEKVQTLNVQNNFYTPGAAPAPKSELEEKVEELDYDDIVEFIEFRREQKRAREEQEKLLNANAKKQLPGGA